MAGIMELRRRILLSSPHIETATGNPLAFQTDMVRPLKSLVVPFSPVQDLHGYDKPWPAGGGVNKWEFGDVNVTGTYSPFTLTTPLPAGTYTISAELVGTSSYANIRFRKEDGSALSQDSMQVNAGRRSFTATFEEPVYRVYLYSAQGASGYEATWKNLQIEAGSTATAYGPYENICPITGWNGFNGGLSSKNLWDLTVYNGGIYNPDVGSTFNLTVAPESMQFIDNGDGTFSTPNISRTWQYLTLIFPMISGVQYHRYIQLLAGGSRAWSFGYLDKDFKVLSKYNDTTTSVQTKSETFSGVNSRYFFMVLTNRTSANISITIRNPIIEYGNAYTGYVPHQGQTISVSWQNKAGEVLGGTATYNGDGTWTLQREWKKITMTGESGASALHSGRTFDGKAIATAYVMFYSQLYRDAYNTKYCLIGDVIGGVKCTHAVVCVNDATAIASLTDAGKTVFTWVAVRGGTVRIQPRIAFPLNTEIDTLAKANAWLAEQYAAGTPVEYTVVLNTPETYTITTEQLITLLGTNTIWTDTNEDLTAQYWSHI